jgi:hypothetical protein
MAVSSPYIAYVGTTAYDLRKVSAVIDIDANTVGVRFIDEPRLTVQFDKTSFEVAWQAALNASGGGGGGLTPIANNTLLGNISGTTAIPIGLTATQVRTLLALAAIATTGSGADLTNSSVTLGKIADIADQTMLGNNTGGAAAPAALTATQVRTLLALAAIATTGSGADLTNSSVTLGKIANINDQTILGNNTGGAAAPVALTAAQTKSILSLPSTANTYCINFAVPNDAAFGNKTQNLFAKVPAGFAGTLVSITGLQTVSGTVTLAVQINNVNVTSLNGLSVTGTPQDVNANSGTPVAVAAGDSIRIVTTSASSDLGLRFTLNLTRS